MTSDNSAWLNPPTRPEVIDSLILSVNRYNPENVAVLDDYVTDQLQNGTYDCMANLALLKLYQFNPDRASSTSVINILVKALTAHPSPDFNLATSLLTDPTLLHPSDDDADEVDLESIVSQLTLLSTLLDACRYQQFWQTYHSNEFANVREYTEECNGFEDAIRLGVADSIWKACAGGGLRSDLVRKWCDLSEGDLEEFCRSRSWRMEDGKVFVPGLEMREGNKQTIVKENIQLDQLTRTIAHAFAT